jgi:O-antigen ligase
MGLLAGLVYFLLLGGTSSGPLIPLLQGLTIALSAVLVVAWVRQLRRGSDLVDRLVIGALLLFLAACLLSAFPRQSLDAALGAVGFSATFGLARRELADPVSRRALVNVLGAIGLVMVIGVVAAWGWIWLSWLQLTGWRGIPPLDLDLPSAVWAHQHDLVIFLCLLAPAIWLGRGQGVRRVVAAIALAALGLVIVMDGSRTVWLAVGLASLVVGAFAMSAEFRSRKALLWGAVAVGMLVVIGVAGGAVGEVVRRVTTISTLDARFAQWVAAVDLWSHRPLQGEGPGSFPFLLRLTDYFQTHGYVSRHPDNAYVHLIADVGLLGVTAWSLLLAALVVGMRRAASAEPALIWALVVVVVAGIGTDPFAYGFLVVPVIVWAAYLMPYQSMSANADARTPMRAWMTRVAAVGVGVVAAAQVATLAASFAYQSAQIDVSAGRLGDADEALTLAVVLDPGMALYWRERGTARYGAAVPGAVSDLQRASNLNAADDVAWRVLALALASKPEAGDAVAAAKEAVRRDAADAANQLILARVAAEVDPHAAIDALAAVVGRSPWILADPSWDAIVSPISNDRILATAVQNWTDGRPQYREPSAGSWLAGMAGDGKDLTLKANGDARNLMHTSQAIIDLLDCRVPGALSDLRVAEPRESRSPSYWPARIMAERLDGGVTPRTIELAPLRRPILRPLLAGSVGPADLLAGGLQDEYGYGRQVMNHASLFIGPSSLGGLQAWLADPAGAAAAALPDSPLARCTR